MKRSKKKKNFCFLYENQNGKITTSEACRLRHHRLNITSQRTRYFIKKVSKKKNMKENIKTWKVRRKKKGKTNWKEYERYEKMILKKEKYGEQIKKKYEMYRNTRSHIHPHTQLEMSQESSSLMKFNSYFFFLFA